MAASTAPFWSNSLRHTRNAGAGLLLVAALLAALPGTARSAQWQIRSLQPMQAIEMPGRGQLRLAGPSRRIDLQLEPNTALVAGGRLGDTEALRGALPGQPGSWARLTRRNGQYRGVYSDGMQVYVVETAGAAAGANRQAGALDPATTVVYRMADVTVAGVLFEGDTVSTARSGAAAFGLIGAEVAAATALQATKRLTVGVLADTELVALRGTTTDSQVLDRLNVVDAIFSSQVGVQIRLGGVSHVDTAADKLGATDAAALVDAVAAYRMNTPAQQAFGLTHLMTGRDLDGTTVGTAFLGGLCSRGFSASLSEARGSSTFDGLIAAHEIGHVFGAPHDGDATAACAATPDNQFLMAPRLSGSSTFSDCSLQQIAPTVAAASCLAPVSAPDPVTDLAIGLSLASTQLTVGGTTPLRATLQNLGTAAVADATFTITLPAGVTATAVNATGLNCTLPASGAPSCTSFALAANAQAAVDLTLRVDQAGSFTLSAALQSATVGDPQTSNNTATVTLSGVASPATGGSNGGSSGTAGGGGSGAGLAVVVALLLASRRLARRYWPVLEK